MIRRTPLSPRIVLALAALGLYASVQGPVARRLFVGAVEANFAARLTLEETTVSLLGSALDVEKASLSASGNGARPLLSCERLFVDVEGIPLLRKKLVIRNATATGLQLHTPSLTSAELARLWPLPPHWKLQRSAQASMRAALEEAWAATASDALAEASTSDLLDVLTRIWPRQMRDLQDDMSIYELRLERLADIASEIATSDNVETSPTSGNSAQQTRSEIADLETGLLAFRQRLESLRRDFQKDRRRMAATHEAEFARFNFPPVLPLPDAESLSDYFLAENASQRAWEIARLIQWAIEFFSSFPTEAAPPEQAGLTLAYAEKAPLPQFTMRAFHFAGQTEIASKPVLFAGTLQNLTNDPQRHGKPLRLVIDAKAPHRVVIEAVIDRRTTDARQRIVIRCPSWPQPAQTWGDETQVAIQTRPSLLSLRAELELSSGLLSGAVRMRQHHLELKPSVADAFGGSRVEDSLREMLAQVDAVEWQVNLDGPLASPAMRLQSPWGAKIAGSLKHSLETELASRIQHGVAGVERELTMRREQWESACQQQQMDLQSRISNALTQIRPLDAIVEKQLKKNPPTRTARAVGVEPIPSPGQGGD